MGKKSKATGAGQLFKKLSNTFKNLKEKFLYV